MSKELADLLIVLVVLAVISAGIILAMRKVSPGPDHSRQILQRWGIPSPTEEQGVLAADYFRQRQRMYPALFAGIGVICYLMVGPDPFLILLITILASLLIGELTAVLRPAMRSRRSAVLIRRGVTDLVPRFTLVLYGIVAVVTLAALVVATIALPWAAYRNQRLAWLLPAGFVLFIVAAAVGVRLSLIRGPLFDDSVLDAALRVRAARVSVAISQLLVAGIAFYALGGVAVDPPTPEWIDVANGVGQWLALIVPPIGAANCIVLLNPSRMSKLVEAARKSSDIRQLRR